MFTFNGVHVTNASLGVLRQTVRTIFPLLPETMDHSLEIAGCDGAYDQGYTYKSRPIRAQFLIRRNTPEELLQYARTVAAWLNVIEAKPLTLDREPDKFYLARPRGGVPLDRILRSGGFCDVLFIAFNPKAFALDAVTDAATGTIQAENTGTLSCPVLITATMAAVSSTLKITLDETDEFILLTPEAGDLQIGDTVIIDTNLRTCTINGVDARDDISFSSTWFWLPVGEFTLSALPVSTDLEITYRERFI